MALRGVTVAFDLDGTLVDTAPDLIGALNGVLAQERLPSLPVESARYLVGRGAKALIARGFEAAGAVLEPAREGRLLADFLRIYRARIAEESRPFPGVTEALEALRSQGAVLSVCTNKPTDLSVLLLDQLSLSSLFALVVGADAAPAPKPDRRHVQAAVEGAGGRLERAALVGDSATDAAAAAAAGVPLILVPHGYSEIPLSEIAATVRIPDFAALPDAVRELFA